MCLSTSVALEVSSMEATVRWCQEKRLLPTERECVCGTECRIVKRSRYQERGVRKLHLSAQGHFLRTPT